MTALNNINAQTACYICLVLLSPPCPGLRRHRAARRRLPAAVRGVAARQDLGGRRIGGDESDPDEQRHPLGAETDGELQRLPQPLLQEVCHRHLQVEKISAVGCVKSKTALMLLDLSSLMNLRLDTLFFW